jgi:hypothetical protein
VTIDAPPERVWATIEPIECHVEWMADARAIVFRTEQRRGVGTEFDCVTKVGPFRTTDRMVVTEWEPARRMGIAHEGLFTGTGRFLLRAKRGGRTQFTWTERIRFPWWAGGPVGALFAAPVLRALWRRNLRRLADLVVSQA